MNQGIENSYANEANRKVAAINGTPVNFNNAVQNAGAGSVGDLYAANSQNKLVGNLLATAGNVGIQGMQYNYMSDLIDKKNQAPTTMNSIMNPYPQSQMMPVKDDFSLGTQKFA